MRNSYLFTTLSSLVIGSMLISSLSLAEDVLEPLKSEHLLVGERAKVLTEEEKREEKRFRIQQEIELDTLEIEQDLDAEEEEEFSKGATYYTTHDGCFQSVTSISFLGDLVELMDGSIWNVDQRDRHKTLDWMAAGPGPLLGDTVIIIPNKDWFSSFDYKLLNLKTGGKIRANLSLGPIVNGFYTHWIVSIDYISGRIKLEDGSMWQMTERDRAIYENWCKNDAVIIGVNEPLHFLIKWLPNWIVDHSSNILINIQLNDYARGDSTCSTCAMQ